MSSAGITTTWIIDRNKFLESLRETEQLMQASQDRLRGLQPIPIRATDEVTPVLDRIVQANQGRSIRVNVEADDGGSGAEGAIRSYGGARGMLRWFRAGEMAVREALDLPQQIDAYYQQQDKAASPAQGASETAEKIRKQSEELGGIPFSVMKAIQGRQGPEEADRAAESWKYREQVRNQNEENERQQIQAESARKRAVIESDVTHPHREALSRLDTETQADEKRAGLEKETRALNDRNEQIKKAMELNKENNSIFDSTRAERQKTLQDEYDKNQSLLESKQKATGTEIANLQATGNIKAQTAAKEDEWENRQRARQIEIETLKSQGNETAAKKLEIDKQADEQEHRTGIANPARDFLKRQIDQEKAFHDFKTAAEANSIAGKGIEADEEARGETGAARRQARIRQATEEAQAARAMAESKKGTEDYAGLDVIAKAKEDESRKLPGRIDVEDQIKAERDLAAAQVTRLGIYDQQAAKLQEIKDKYDELKQAASPVEKDALDKKEQAELDAVHERQQRNVNDIKEHTKEMSLRAAGRDEDAKKAEINYKYDKEIEDQRKAFALDKDDTHNDTIKALEDERKAELAAAQTREVSFNSPLAAWERMQKIAYETPAVAAANLPAQGQVNILSKAQGATAGDPNAVAGPGGLEGHSKMNVAADKLGEFTEKLSGIFGGVVHIGVVSDGYGS
nr:hypothetical protein [uncultured Rhodopila sp.]